MLAPRRSTKTCHQTPSIIAKKKEITESASTVPLGTVDVVKNEYTYMHYFISINTYDCILLYVRMHVYDLYVFLWSLR